MESVATAPIANKADIARAFGAASATYEGASRLQRMMGDAMVKKLADERHSPASVLDLGCGTGWFSRVLSQVPCVKDVTGVDLSAGMVEQARQQGGAQLSWLVADAERLPFPDQSFDIVFSNLMIQWCSDPRPVLRQCRRLLKPGGQLMISTLLDGTLRELKTAWAQADPGRPHINRFESGERLADLVDRELPGAQITRRTITLPYRSPLALTGELKQLGAGFKSDARRKTLTGPGRVRAMCQAYPTHANGTVSASYEAAWIYWRP
ncbi:malonyl-ACP O-methyltransferase BioC [Marinobacter salinisoli]|uniref:Malonyl-[acyl-carrier protein] O-methyltransferase n=2 Tax=Marinobacter salinisoli TaxID=2769486 RepID=A0ABX7MW13_9GAMM|nr:malonyl-ACP O-methyltransferase BioC [Marinobacter salinisoli]